MVNLPIVLMFDDEDEVLKFASNINTIINGKVKIKYELLGMLNNQHVGIFYLQRHDEFSQLREQFVKMIENEEILEHNRKIVKRNGGVECDTDIGPCACGVWHEPKPPAKPNKLTAAEHSVLLYLIDGLVAAPEKAEKLLEMSIHTNGSIFYRDIIQRLENAAGDTASLLAECGQIKSELL